MPDDARSQSAEDRAEAAFERVWNNFRIDKARLRNLSEKDKAELKMLMKTVFMSSMAMGEAPKEIKFELEGGVDSDEVEGAVRKVVQEELGGIKGLLEQLRDRPAQVIQGGGITQSADVSAEQAAVALHSALFNADMETNIDEVEMDGGDVGSVSGNLAALRKLMDKGGGDDADNA